MRWLVGAHWQSCLTTPAGSGAVGTFAERAPPKYFHVAKQHVVGSVKVAADAIVARAVTPAMAGVTDAHAPVNHQEYFAWSPSNLRIVVAASRTARRFSGDARRS